MSHTTLNMSNTIMPNTTMAPSIFNTVAQPSDLDSVMASSPCGPAATPPPPPPNIPISTHQVLTQPRQLSYLEKLPPEIQSLVLENLPKPGLGNIRLTCNLLNEVATPIIARKISVTFSLKSFQNLIRVTRSRALSPHVRFLEYTVCLLRKVVTQEILQLYYTLHLKTLSPDLRLTPNGAIDPSDPNFPPQAELNQVFKSYRLLMGEQDKVIEMNIPGSTFTQTLHSLPNLMSIQVTSSSASRATHQLSKTFGPNLVDAGQSRRLDFTFKPLIDAFIIDKMTIQHLQVDGLYWSIFNHSTPQFDYRMDIFSNLVTIYLIFEYREEDHLTKSFPVRRQDMFGTCLASAQHLERLALRFKTPGDEKFAYQSIFTCPAFWSALAKDTVWPSLKSLELDNLIFSAEHAARFFEQHAKTLKHVFLRKLWLMENPTDWQIVFRSMQTHLTFDRLSLRCVWGGGLLSNDMVPRFIDMFDKVGIRLATSIAGSKAALMGKRARRKSNVQTYTRIPPSPGEAEKLAEIPEDPMDNLGKYLTLLPRHKHR